ncbi:zinc finger CCCH domain-containing protein 19-like isoform X4 [Amaranthus tricolor]|uniref:zinc finger CCCH domain-containing protein 19-like isoform X4 n=1 Tax=Amaranthus tricolor TaxID=29722 RepID=UPI0025901A8C|nr:zinc finger CCCH domain-containing protein 19-like isoform X4 [Amaranthus tricolor]
MLKRKRRDKEKVENGENTEDYCFVCKDGGLLMVCDHKECIKAYHPQCVSREESTEDVDEQWICDWHYCLICRKNSRFQCFCCPNAVCLRCFKDALFAKVKGNKGFCNDCLKLALLEEEGMEVDSDGEKVDFNDRETYEGLFKEYFDIIKGKEGLMLKDLHYADVQMKKGENCRSLSLKLHQSQRLPSDSDKSIKEEENKELPAFKHDNDDGEQTIIAYKKEPKMLRRRKGPKRIEFAGWASKPLIEFLASIRADTGKKLSQDDVASIVSNYAHENKLLHPDKKKLILCDIRLRSLLGRNSIRLYQVKNVLKPHFIDQSEDEGYRIGSDNDKVTSLGKNQAWRTKLKSFQHKKSHLDKFQRKKSILDKPNKTEVVVKVIYSPYATIGLQNMKLVYLKKCLVEKLLEQHESFESKVVGSFVKVKSEPFDARHPYQLLSVIGVQHFGDGNEKVCLQLSNLPNDVPLCLLSNDDLSEQDCEELRQKFDNNVLSKPTVATLEKKAKDLHEDLTKHWITTELSILRNRIDLANEKGRRAKLFEYYRKLDLLQSEGEQARLLNEVPKVLADVIEVKPESDEGNVSSPGKNQAWETKIGSIQHKGFLMEKFQLKESIIDKPNKTKGVVKAICSRYGTIGPQNMKLVYLKKCLVEKLLEQRESFESKVVGSFVKVRSNPFDARHPCQLLPVIGVQNSGEGNEKVHLQVSNLPNNIPIHLLSNEAISEQDCEELRHKVDNGLIPKPTVVALEKKAKDLHEDLTRHRITIELSILRNRIDAANEKGQRAKLFEYRRKKDLLESEAEQARLLNEVPKVLADVIELKSESEEYSSGFDKDNVPLKPHFVENVDQSKDEVYSSGYDKDNVSMPAEKQNWRRKVGSIQRNGLLLEKFQQKESISDKPNQTKVVVEDIYSRYATIGPQNMKLVYLKKCFVEKLLENRESFESKVVGSFVKVKSDPFDAKHPYQLLPVIGVQNSGDGNEKVLLQISNLASDVPMRLLSNDDISEVLNPRYCCSLYVLCVFRQDYEELRQKVDNGLISKPTVEALEKKVKDLHEDMTKHMSLRSSLNQRRLGSMIFPKLFGHMQIMVKNQKAMGANKSNRFSAHQVMLIVLE